MSNLELDYDEPEDTDNCPECGTFTIKRSEDNSYEYCTKCGLVTRASIEYVAGRRIKLPYGLIII